MTEQEWLAANHPGHLLAFLHDRAGLSGSASGRRKSRLFACACCRRVWPLIDDDDFRQAVQLSEDFADDRTVPGELQTFRLDLLRRRRRSSPATLLGIGVTEGIAANAVLACLDPAATTVVPPKDLADYSTVVEAEACLQCQFLRDIFGNPFRKAETSPSAWLTTSVVALANAAYEERRFDNMPILADALEEAGCTDAEILAHCRGSGPHVRGCWVVDLILGRE